MRNIVQNIPHSSTAGVFDPVIGKWPRNPHLLMNGIGKLTDLYTDFLFATDTEGVSSVVFPYSRFVCDAERLDDDPMEKIGQGIIYTNFGAVERGNLDKDAVDAILGLRAGHLRKLSEGLTEGSVLIDCHSFTPDDNGMADICVGYNDDWSYDKRVVEAVVLGFRNRGYTVSENAPFSNSITPPSEHKYASVMIEVNKRLYMDTSFTRLSFDTMKAARWFGTLDAIREKILHLPFEAV